MVRNQDRRGNYAMIVAMGSIAIMGFGALAIDFSYLRVADIEVQNAADAGAHAALVEYRRAQDTDTARTAAITVMDMNEIAGDSVVVDPFGDIEFGGWDFGAHSFDTSASFTNAVRVRVRRTGDSPGGPIPMLLAPVFGAEFSNAKSEGWSIAALRTREVMVAQDVTGSFKDEIDEAKVADLVLLDNMADTQFPNDKIGMNTFGGGSVIFTELLNIEAEYDNIRPVWETLDWCSKEKKEKYCKKYNSNGSCKSWGWKSYDPKQWYRPQIQQCTVGGGGTNQGSGIELATDTLLTDGEDQAIKVVVLVSDGEPWCSSSSCKAARVAYGHEMADYAADNDVSIFSISFNYPFNATQSAYMEALVRGYGAFFETPDESELPAILAAVGNMMPVALVE